MKVLRRIRRQPRILLRPDHQTYLLIHVLIFIAGLLLVSVGGPLWVAIGTSVSATGISGWAIFIWIQMTDRFSKQAENVRKIGLVNAFPARSVPIRPEYEARFANAREEINFLGFGLRALREDFLDQFPFWLERVRIRILLIDLEAPHEDWTYVAQRDREEANTAGSIANDVMTFVKATLPLKNRYRDRIHVRLYRCLPSVNVCRIDDEIFWGPYVVGEQSRNTPTFLVERAGPLFTVLFDHFERIWTDEEYSRDAHELSRDGRYRSVLN